MKARARAGAGGRGGDGVSADFDKPVVAGGIPGGAAKAVPNVTSTQGSVRSGVE